MPLLELISFYETQTLVSHKLTDVLPVRAQQYTSLYTNSTPGNDLAVAILNTQPGDLTGWLGYGYDCLAQVLQVNTSGFPSE